MYPNCKWRFGLCLLLVLACKPVPTEKPTPSSIETFKNLKIMSTPPQKWELTINTGHKTKRNQLVRDITWKSDLWNFKSPLANSSGQEIITLSFPSLRGHMLHHPIALSAEQNLFQTDQTLLKGENLHLYHQQHHWQLTAEHYQSAYPWSQLKLYNVKGRFLR